MKRNLVLLGEFHTDESSVEFRKKLCRLATDKEIVVGIEGLIREEKREREYTQLHFGTDRGYFFGLENIWVMDYNELVMFYDLCNFRVRDQRDMYMAGLLIAGVLEQLTKDEHMKRIWADVDRSSIPNQSLYLYRHLSSIIRNFDPKRKALENQEFHDIIACGPEPWKGITGTLLNMLRPQTEIYMTERQYKSISYLHGRRPNFIRRARSHRTLMKWRNAYMFDNLCDVADFAKSKDQDVFFTMGSAHLKGISRKLGWGSRGFRKHVCYSWVHMPNYIRPF